MDRAVQRAVEVLRAGGLVGLPTETVYGLGADALSETAVARVFEAKDRPRFDPLICHLGSRAEVDALATDFDSTADRLAAAFWPGPLTLVVPKRSVVSDLVTAGAPTVGIRVPAHPLMQAVLQGFEGPIAAPSANPFAAISPTTAEHVRTQLGDKLDFILDGGPCSVGLESTIILVLPHQRPVLLRPGGLPLESIEAVVGSVVVPPPGSLSSAAPGRSLKHYSPKTPLFIEPTHRPHPQVARLAYRDAPPGFGATVRLSPTGDLTEAASKLFAALQTLDGGGWHRIEAQPVPETGLGRAIMDRLRRAAAR